MTAVERQTSVALDDDGRPVVRHVSGPGPAADALRHEAAALAQCRGLGVVEVISLRDGPADGATLDTRFVAGGSLDDLVPDGDQRTVVAMLTEVAATLARLHEVGVVHGRCSADHVLGAPGDVRLCGLRDARIGPGPVGSAAEVDTRAFAQLVEATCVGDHELTRRARHAVRGLDVSPPTTSLLAVAGNLRGLAGEVAAPGARVLAPRRREPTRRSPLDTARAGVTALPGGAGGKLLVGAAVVVTVFAVVAIALLTTDRRPTTALETADPPASAVSPGQGSPPARPRAPDTDDGQAPAPTTTAPTTTAPTTTAPTNTAPTTTAPTNTAPTTTAPTNTAPTTTAPTTTARSSPSTLAGTEAVGGAVEHDGVRFQVGEPGDLVVVGDWECDGVVTPGLVRPTDGSVWAFRSWALGNEVVVAERVGRASEPRQAAVGQDDDGCDVIEVTTADGDEEIVAAS